MSHTFKDMSSESVENLNLELQSLIAPCAQIQLSKLAVCMIYFLFGIYPAILILMAFSTSIRAEIITQELHVHIYQCSKRIYLKEG